jgi:hypothetical protein
MGGTTHTCDDRCVAPSDKVHIYYIYCYCKNGCKNCKDGKIYIHDCPYTFVDNEIVIFKQMYARYKNGSDLYGSFNELPSILWQYFNILETEIDRHTENKEAIKQENADISAYVMSGKKNG